jgi:xanthine dehydrogenase molybdopterin-binding subunit B
MKFDELVEKYIKLRERKAELKSQYEAKVGQVDTLMSQIEAVILTTFQQTGMDSVRTAAGTAYKSTRTSATIADWDSFLAFVKANGAFEMLERRCNKTAVEQFRAANDDLPPGVNFRAEVTIGVRRS